MRKLRGTRILGGPHELTIDTDGVTVHPRTEAVFRAPPSSAVETRTRLPFGISRLDAMLAGGLPSASTTVVLGTPGAGKTLLALHMLTAGADRGEPGVYFGFNETPPRLLAKANSVGLDLAPAVESGLVSVLWQPSITQQLDSLAERLLRTIETLGARRLVIDGFEGFQRAAVYPDRLSPFLAALTNELRARDVTTLVTVELRELFGPRVEVPIDDVATIAENVIFLRYFELRSELNRLISVLKMRESSHDTTIRAFTIGPRGLSVAEPFSSAEALLTGVARPFRDDADAPPAGYPADRLATGDPTAGTGLSP